MTKMEKTYTQILSCYQKVFSEEVHFCVFLKLMRKEGIQMPSSQIDDGPALNVGLVVFDFSRIRTSTAEFC